MAFDLHKTLKIASKISLTNVFSIDDKQHTFACLCCKFDKLRAISAQQHTHRNIHLFNCNDILVEMQSFWPDKTATKRCYIDRMSEDK